MNVLAAVVARPSTWIATDYDEIYERVILYGVLFDTGVPMWRVRRLLPGGSITYVTRVFQVIHDSRILR